MTFRFWSTGRHLVHQWECCGQRWELMVTAWRRGDGTWRPICLRCDTDLNACLYCHREVPDARLTCTYAHMKALRQAYWHADPAHWGDRTQTSAVVVAWARQQRGAPAWH